MKYHLMDGSQEVASVPCRQILNVQKYDTPGVILAQTVRWRDAGWHGQNRFEPTRTLVQTAVCTVHRPPRPTCLGSKQAFVRAVVNYNFILCSLSIWIRQVFLLSVVRPEVLGTYPTIHVCHCHSRQARSTPCRSLRKPFSPLAPAHTWCIVSVAQSAE